MDFTDLLNSIKETIRPGSTSIQTEPGQTYGPSESRITHTPIRYRTGLPQGESGEYNNYFSSLAGKIIPGNHPVIKIDPTATDIQNTYGGQVQPVLKHEITHAILEKANPNYDKLAASNPAYAQAMMAVADKRLGDMPAEVPAYMAEPGAAQRWGVPQNIVDLYRQHLQSNMDSATASAYARNMGK